MTSNSGRSEAYEKNIKEQYEALGRLVEAFEAMVDEARQVCIELVSRDGKHRDLVEILLHHQSLTAKPIFEMCRAVIAEIINASLKSQEYKEKGIVETEPPHVTDSKGRAVDFTPTERGSYFGLMRFIASEYDDLVNKRNNLLHATWFIGFSSSDDQDCKDFYVRKYTTNKEGFSSIELPKNADELKKLSDRCDVTRTWIGWLHSCVCGDSKLSERFEQRGKEWWLVSPAGSKTTLPQR